MLHVGQQSFPQSVAGTSLLLPVMQACLACAGGGLAVDCALQACVVRDRLASTAERLPSLST